jgi:hypothetical protein
MAVMVLLLGDLLRRRRGAAMSRLAAVNFKLDRCVGDPEAVAQGTVDGVENARAL